MASSDADPVGRVLEACGLVLDRARPIGPRRPVVVAVSGGADSLCLLDAMVTVLEGAKQRVIVGHVDHMLRPESAADAEHVRRVAVEHGVRCEVFQVDVPALMAAERRGLEETARLGRYRALRELAEQTGAAAVLTGHTRDDSVETILMHLLRGSGMHGLTGIAQVEQLTIGTPDPRPDAASTVNAVRLIRPLLGVGRADTVGYCAARSIPYLTDETNADPRFLRNRVRNHLLPVLRTYNPSFDRALVRMANVMAEEDAWLDREASRRTTQIREHGDADPVLNLAAWRRQPLPLQRRIVRQLASQFGVDELGYEAVERALAVGTEHGPPRAELGSGLAVERRRDTLVFSRSQNKREEAR